MSQTEQILDRFVEQQGWTRGTVLDLLLTYIENQDDPGTFEDYLTSLAAVDAEMEPDEEDDDEVIDMTPICSRHGGPWGSDETCIQCTNDDGTIKEND